MIVSMTGFGCGEVSQNGIAARVEVRSVNSRFLEVTVRTPRTIQARENDVKELVRKKLVRGKINISITLERDATENIALKVNHAAAKAYYTLLQELRKTVKIKEPVSLQHVLNFPEVIESPAGDESDSKEWSAATAALHLAFDQLLTMRSNEGQELQHDITRRVQGISRMIEEIDASSKLRVPQERERLREKLNQLVSDTSIIDEKRLELEIIFLADKLDVTEECVRFRSHNKFFLEALSNDEAAGRKLLFILQEMNREANTIGSKSSDATISQKIVVIKEELEKIREQLQNIE